MNYGKVLTSVIAVLSFLAAAGYAVAGDWRRAAYFFFAGCLNATFVL
jgi:hypothetical protein